MHSHTGATHPLGISRKDPHFALAGSTAAICAIPSRRVASDRAKAIPDLNHRAEFGLSLVRKCLGRKRDTSLYRRDKARACRQRAHALQARYAKSLASRAARGHRRAFSTMLGLCGYGSGRGVEGGRIAKLVVEMPIVIAVARNRRERARASFIEGYSFTINSRPSLNSMGGLISAQPPVGSVTPKDGTVATCGTKRPPLSDEALECKQDAPEPAGASWSGSHNISDLLRSLHVIITALGISRDTRALDHVAHASRSSRPFHCCAQQEPARRHHAAPNHRE